MKIKIGGIEYLCKEQEELKSPKGTRLNGHIQYEDKVILIDRGLRTGVKSVVYLHEILHGILYHAGGKHRERDIEMFSRGLYQVFKENKKAIKEILWGEK